MNQQQLQNDIIRQVHPFVHLDLPQVIAKFPHIDQRLITTAYNQARSMPPPHQQQQQLLNQPKPQLYHHHQQQQLLQQQQPHPHHQQHQQHQQPQQLQQQAYPPHFMTNSFNQYTHPQQQPQQQPQQHAFYGQQPQQMQQQPQQQQFPPQQLSQSRYFMGNYSGGVLNNNRSSTPASNNPSPSPAFGVASISNNNNIAPVNHVPSTPSTTTTSVGHVAPQLPMGSFNTNNNNNTTNIQGPSYLMNSSSSPSISNGYDLQPKSLQPPTPLVDTINKNGVAQLRSASDDDSSSDEEENHKGNKNNGRRYQKSSAPGKVNLKVFLPHEEIRRLRVDEAQLNDFNQFLSTCCSFDKNLNEIVKSEAQNAINKLKLFYRDEESDWVRVTSAQEWSEALQFHLESVLRPRRRRFSTVSVLAVRVVSPTVVAAATTPTPEVLAPAEKSSQYDQHQSSAATASNDIASSFGSLTKNEFTPMGEFEQSHPYGSFANSPSYDDVKFDDAMRRLSVMGFQPELTLPLLRKHGGKIEPVVQELCNQ